MRIFVKAKTHASKEQIEKIAPVASLFTKTIESDVYKVSVCEPPVDGKANSAIIRVVALHFGVAPSLVSIISGLTSSTKIIEIKNE